VFVSQTHLPQLLDLAHYTDPVVRERELRDLFLPGWHCVAVWDQFRRDGDYRTFELLGRPLILWRTGDRITAFLNVCTHRFSTLTDKPCGHFAGRMKCQYHGWEYDSQGNTCKIPDAQSFRPLKKGELGLREYRVELVGQLVFVTLNDAAPPLRDYLGAELVELCEGHFSREHRLTNMADLSPPCNWKIVVENLLESYHLESVHPKTFKRFPVPEHCTHEFHPTYDYYIHDYREEPGSVALEKFACRMTGQAPELKWRHIVRYPNIAVGGSGPIYYLAMIWPVTGTTCRELVFTMHYAGPRGRWGSFWVHRLMKRFGGFTARQIQNEDMAIFPSIQRGTSSPDRPHSGGLISAREERIVAFQEYVLRGLGEPVPASHPAMSQCIVSAESTADVDAVLVQAASVNG
jgi:choline monooxygenase